MVHGLELWAHARGWKKPLAEMALFPGGDGCFPAGRRPRAMRDANVRAPESRFGVIDIDPEHAPDASSMSADRPRVDGRVSSSPRPAPRP